MKHSDFERAALDAALLRLGLEIEEQQKVLLLDHLALLMDKNITLNLTRVTELDDAITLHIEDSLAVLPEFETSEGLILDLGTGGGFPGIPLSIVTGREGYLLDSVQKKAAAVEGFIQELGLDERLAVRGCRSEELAREMPEEFGVVTARAVAQIPVLLELSAPLLRFKGLLVALKGVESSEDQKRAEIASERLGFELVSSRSFEIGTEHYSRSVYVYRKVAEPQIKLPRRPGMAAKRPVA